MNAAAPSAAAAASAVPPVSVVIPSARGGNYLREAVASVQGQTTPSWELIVVADGCEDELSDVGDGDPRIKIVFQTMRRGESVARNVGVRLARAPMVAFLDDDDRMLPDRLNQQLKAMQDHRIGLCYTLWRVIDEYGVPIETADRPEADLGGEPQYRDLLRGGVVPPITSSMVRKSLFEEVGGFDSVMRMTPDWDLIFRIARESQLRRIPQVLTEYRVHRNNSRPITGSSGGMLSTILTRHLCRAEDAGNEEDIKAARVGLAKANRGHARSAIRRAREAASVGEYATAARLTTQAFRLSPTRAAVTLLRGMFVKSRASS